jgi:hypothetical protein
MSKPISQGWRARIEKLEQLVSHLSGSGGGSVGVSFAGPVVANEAAAAAFPLSDVPGETMQVFVLTHRSIWTKRNGVAGVQGVPPLAPHEVIAATAGPAGVLCRTEYTDPALRTGINDIYIDPANILANDENDGLTPTTPLKTGYELFRRWGWGASKPIVGPNLATSPDGFTNVHIVSDIVSPDTLPVRITIAINGSMRFIGGTPTTIRTSTLTGASTAMNPAVPLGGTRLRLVDAATATWVPDMAANRRGRITTGAQAGATFQPQTNVGVGGAVDASAAQTTNEPAFDQSPHTVTPAAGSTYVIEALVQCNFGAFEITEEQNPAFGGFNSFINFIDLNFPAIGGNAVSWEPVTSQGTFSQPFFNFYQCTFDRLLDITSCPSAQLIACYFFNAGLFNYCTGGVQGFNGGGMNAGGGGVSSIEWASVSAQSTLDFNLVANQTNVALGSCSSCRLFASWNAPAGARNTAGHGILVGILGGVRAAVTFSTIWGAGNGGAGVLIGAGCRGVGPSQNITGVQGDVKLANSSSTVGNNVYWQAATGIYVGATGVAGVASAATWALITAAKGAPGYGNNVHNPDADAHWVALETTA